MARENVEVVRRIYDAVERRDTEAILALYDPDLEMDWSRSPFRQFLNQTVYRGHEGLRAFTRERAEDWPDWSDHLEELIGVGERVVSVVRSRGVGRTSGLELAQTHAALWSFRDGRVRRMWWFRSQDEALEAAAGPEQPVPHANVERAREVLQGLGRLDADGLIELAAEDVTWRSFFAVAEADGTYRGHAGTRRYVADLADAWDAVRADVDDALEVEDLAVLVGRIVYRGKGSGVEGESAAGWVMRFREGKLVSFRAFHDPRDALEAVGLAET